jgi:hypothetical protein
MGDAGSAGVDQESFGKADRFSLPLPLHHSIPGLPAWCDIHSISAQAKLFQICALRLASPYFPNLPPMDTRLKISHQSYST